MLITGMFLSTWQMFFNHDQIRADDSLLANEGKFHHPDSRKLGNSL